MEDMYENAAENFLELSSHQRLEILFNLLEKKSNVSAMAKQLDATNQEVHRNFMRLEDGGLIAKNKDGKYAVSTYGRTMCSQVPALIFLSKNRKYFENHDFGEIPDKFIKRVGQLANCEYLKGFTKVLEEWKSIYKNANTYIYKISSEVPLDLIEPLIKQIKKGILYNGVLLESAIVPKGRRQLLKKLGYDKLLAEGKAERKMKKDVKTVVVLNEKEACISFPKLDGETNLAESFYSEDPMFHEWCLDFFRYCWYGSDLFQESKLKE